MSMQIKFDYYYNNVPKKGLCRNNLIYTSLISEDKKTFCQWFYNDPIYHNNQNEIVDGHLMIEKWNREVEYLTKMHDVHPDLVPEILEINEAEKKIYLKIDGPDLWELSGCQGIDYSNVVPDWDLQMLEIFQAHKNLGLYKYSLHPSSYFVIDNKLKSINYFFTYHEDEPPMIINNVMSHISKDRQSDLLPKMSKFGIDVYSPVPHSKIQILAFESFKTNYRKDVMEKAKKIYDI